MRAFFIRLTDAAFRCMDLVGTPRFLGLCFLFSAALFVGLGSGCKTKQLEPGGPYGVHTNVVGTNTVVVASDPTFFAIDSTFDLLYTAIDSIFTLESNNRELFWKLSPEIKHACDRIRPQALATARRYAEARRVYQANPTPNGLSALQNYLSQLQQFSNALSTVLPKQ